MSYIEKSLINKAMGRNKVYSQEFRQEVIASILSGRFNYKQASVHYHISGKCTVSLWVKQHLEEVDTESGAVIPSVSGKEHSGVIAYYKARIAELEKKLETPAQAQPMGGLSGSLKELQHENNKLKAQVKVMDILVQESSKLVGFGIEKKFGTK
jgi:transposase-like protein